MNSVYYKAKQRLLRQLPSSLRFRLNALVSRFDWTLEPEVSHIGSYIPKQRRRIALDIGANNGITASAFARVFNTIYAFEPNPELINQWRNHCSSQIKVIQAGVTNCSKIATLRIPVVNGQALSGWASFDKPLIGDALSENTLHVQTTTVDEFVGKMKLEDLDFVKIDVEGHEDFVLQGAQQALVRFSPWILCEVSECNRKAVCARVQSLGYSVKSLKELIGKEGSPQNLVFAPPDR